MQGGVGGTKAKTKKQDNTMVEFRVAITSICTHKGPIFTTRPRETFADSGSDIRSPLPNWSPPLVHFHQSWIYTVRKSTLEK